VKPLKCIHEKFFYKNLKKINPENGKKFYTRALYVKKFNIILIGVLARLRKSNLLNGKTLYLGT